MGDISQDDGIINVVQIVLKSSIKYTGKRFDLLYLKCSGYNKSVPRHFPFLHSFKTCWNSSISGVLLYTVKSSGGKTWG